MKFFIRSLFACIAVVVMLLVASCHKDKGGFRIKFQPTFGGQNLKMNTTYTTPDNKYVSVTSLGLYLSHIKLVRTDDTEVEVDSAVLLYYTGDAINIDLQAVSGNYQAIKFSIGLDSLQNQIVPQDTDVNSAYANSVLWWPTSQGHAERLHLFTQTEGRADTTTAFTSRSGFFYHVGFSTNYRTTTITKSFSIADGKSTDLTLGCELQTLFYGVHAVDFQNHRLTHSDDYPAVAATVADAYQNSFSIR